MNIKQHTSTITTSKNHENERHFTYMEVKRLIK